MSGMPTQSDNSSGAAPVPPSPPSMTMKSGVMPVASMALVIAKTSCGWPTQSLMPTGLPPDSSRSFAANSSIPAGESNAEWPDGDRQSSQAGTPRTRAISSVTFAAGNSPPWPGFAPWLSLISVIFTQSSEARSPNAPGSNVPFACRAPK